ncbi:hypothetical protein BG000_002957 [Podila horticola]|nr:hypothetical protein BG000_002957 [Podila horticola]
MDSIYISRLYVRNLPPWARVQDLLEVFSVYGTIRRCTVPHRDRYSIPSRSVKLHLDCVILRVTLPAITATLQEDTTRWNIWALVLYLVLRIQEKTILNASTQEHQAPEDLATPRVVIAACLVHMRLDMITPKTAPRTTLTATGKATTMTAMEAVLSTVMTVLTEKTVVATTIMMAAIHFRLARTVAPVPDHLSLSLEFILQTAIASALAHPEQEAAATAVTITLIPVEHMEAVVAITVVAPPRSKRVNKPGVRGNLAHAFVGLVLVQ